MLLISLTFYVQSKSSISFAHNWTYFYVQLKITKRYWIINEFIVIGLRNEQNGARVTCQCGRNIKNLLCRSVCRIRSLIIGLPYRQFACMQDIDFIIRSARRLDYFILFEEFVDAAEKSWRNFRSTCKWFPTSGQFPKAAYQTLFTLAQMRPGPEIQRESRQPSADESVVSRGRSIGHYFRAVLGGETVKRML